MGTKCPGHVEAFSLHQERCCGAWTTGLLKVGPQLALGQWQLHAVALHSLRWAANNGGCMVCFYIACAGQPLEAAAWRQLNGGSGNRESTSLGFSEGDTILSRLLTGVRAPDQLERRGVWQLNILSKDLV